MSSSLTQRIIPYESTIDAERFLSDVLDFRVSELKRLATETKQNNSFKGYLYTTDKQALDHFLISEMFQKFHPERIEYQDACSRSDPLVTALQYLLFVKMQ